MPLDPSIITGIKPVQIDSPVNALAQVLKIQSMQQEGQLGQAKLDEYTRTKARQNKLLELVQGLPANTTDEQRLGALKGGGYFDEADKLETGMLNRRKVESEAKAKEWDAQSKKLDLAGQAFGFVRQNPTLEAANQVLDYLGQNGVYSPETVAQYKATVAADPSKIASLADTAFRTVLGAKEQLMKVDTRNLGGSTQTTGTDPLTGKVTVLSTAANTQSPDNVATVAATKRGQDLTNARAREQLEAGKSQVVQSDNGPVLVNTRDGTGKQITVGGQPVGPKLKDIPASVNTAMIANSQSLATLDRTIALLEGKDRDGQLGDSAATGLKGYLPQQVLNKVDPKGIDARAGVADIGSLKLHDRSGAAVTASESPRLMPFIPTATDSNETALKKLKRLRLEAQNETSALAETYSKDAGYRANPVAARNAGKGAMPGVPDDIAALIQKHGGK